MRVDDRILLGAVLKDDGEREAAEDSRPALG
jgi:hypothetical protein